MIVIAGYVGVPSAAKAELQKALETFVADTREEAGCRDFSFAYDAVEPEKLRVFEVFDDRAAFEAHRNSPHMAEWRSVRARLGVNERHLKLFDIAAVETI
jgi:quinol monooxygenase YgiN